MEELLTEINYLRTRLRDQNKRITEQYYQVSDLLKTIRDQDIEIGMLKLQIEEQSQCTN